MKRFGSVSMLLLSGFPFAHNQGVEVFQTELFLNDNADLDSGLYEGTVSGRRRFSETQVPHGQGSIYYFTNDRFNRHNYTGSWVNGTREGNGTTFFRDGAIFTGLYKNGLETSVGTISYPNGNTLEAEFQEGRIQGHGVFRYTNGDQREGFFRDNILDGQVIFTRHDGVTVIETWEDGVRLEDQDRLVQNGDDDGQQISGIQNTVSPNHGGSTDFGGDLPPPPVENPPPIRTVRPEGLQRLRNSIRSGGRIALFSSLGREGKVDGNEIDYKAIRERSRSDQNAFLRKLFQAVNSRRR